MLIVFFKTIITCYSVNFYMINRTIHRTDSNTIRNDSPFTGCQSIYIL